MNDDTPTPRVGITLEWKDNATYAREVAERCRAKARAVTMARVGSVPDFARATALGDIAGLCDHYRRRFEDWAVTVVPYEQKERELRAFGCTVQVALVELEDARPRK